MTFNNLEQPTYLV